MGRTRPQRWRAALLKARRAIKDMKTGREQTLRALDATRLRIDAAELAVARIRAGQAELQSALQKLQELVDEYSMWDVCQSHIFGKQADKLFDVTNLQLPHKIDNLRIIERTIEEAENTELPRGYGRD